MSYPVQEYHPLVIDTSYMADYLDENGRIIDKDDFEKSFGLSLYDFCVAVLSGNYINVCRRITSGVSDTIVELFAENDIIENLYIYRGEYNQNTYGGISIVVNNVYFDKYDVEYIAKLIVDNLIEIAYYEI